jgi:cytochrome c6
MRNIVSAVAIVALVLAGGMALAAEDGKALYDKKCAMCHGKDGVAHASMGKGSANFNDAAYTASIDDIVKVTLAGKNKMPAYEGKMTADEVKAVAEYILTLKPKK